MLETIFSTVFLPDMFNLLKLVSKLILYKILLIFGINSLRSFTLNISKINLKRSFKSNFASE